MMSEDFQRVKDATDLVAYVESRGIYLKKAGSAYKALCPFHAEKSPSFVVNPETQRWQCFGACGVGGTVIDFVMKYDNADESEALRIVAEYARIDLSKHEDPHKRLYEVLEFATQQYIKNLYTANSQSRTAMSYLIETRKLTTDIIQAARIGFASQSTIRLFLQDRGFTDKEMLDAGILAKADDGSVYDHFRNRIMIPVMDERGRVVGFNGRAMGDTQPKYKNSPETAIFKKSKILYTLREKNAQGKALDPIQVKTIVEGPFDALSGLMRGFRGIYAQMGSALSVDQLTKLVTHGTEKIVFCFDNDGAGGKMMHRLAKEHVHTAAQLGVDLLIMRPPHGKDADDTFREHPELWQSAVDAARLVVDVLIDLELSPLPQNATAVQKTNAARKLVPMLKHDNRIVEKENFGKLAARLDLSDDEMERLVRPQLTILHTPPPAPKQETHGAPTSEEWVLHGILCYEGDGWLERANSRLLLSSDDMMPYALAPLGIEDFTDRDARRLMDLIIKARQAGETYADYLHEHVERPLQASYKRIVDLDEIGKTFLMPFDYDIFVHYVYEVRIKRLIKERPTFEAKDPAKARECAMAIACLRLAQEDLLDTM
jgi:DNA primase